MDKYIRVKNCNCISDATIEIVEKSLNIKYGSNGTGKSTISKAIEAFVTNDQESDVYIERFIGYQKGMQVLGLQSYDSALFDSKQASTLEAFVKTVQKKKITPHIIIGDVV